MKLRVISNVVFTLAPGSNGLRLYVWQAVGCDRLPCKA